MPLRRESQAPLELMTNLQPSDKKILLKTHGKLMEMAVVENSSSFDFDVEIFGEKDKEDSSSDNFFSSSGITGICPKTILFLQKNQLLENQIHLQVGLQILRH